MIENNLYLAIIIIIVIIIILYIVCYYSVLSINPQKNCDNFKNVNNCDHTVQLGCCAHGIRDSGLQCDCKGHTNTSNMCCTNGVTTKHQHCNRPPCTMVNRFDTTPIPGYTNQGRCCANGINKYGTTCLPYYGCANPGTC